MFLTIHESRRAVEVNFTQGKSTLRITMSSDDASKSSWMIKPKVEANKGV